MHNLLCRAQSLLRCSFFLDFFFFFWYWASWEFRFTIYIANCCFCFFCFILTPFSFCAFSNTLFHSVVCQQPVERNSKVFRLRCISSFHNARLCPTWPSTRLLWSVACCVDAVPCRLIVYREFSNACCQMTKYFKSRTSFDRWRFNFFFLLAAHLLRKGFCLWLTWVQGSFLVARVPLCSFSWARYMLPSAISHLPSLPVSFPLLLLFSFFFLPLLFSSPFPLHLESAACSPQLG